LSSTPVTTTRSSLTSLTSYLLVAKVLSFGLNVILPLLLVRRLSQTDLGIYKQAFQIVATSIVLLPLGFQMSAFYFLPREPENRGSVVFNVLLFHLLMSSLGGLALALFPQALAWVFSSPALVPYAPVLGMVIVVWGASAFLETVVVANQEGRLSGTMVFGVQLSKTILLVSAAAIFGTVGSLIYAALLQGTLQSCVLLYYLESRFPGFWRRVDWPMFSRQISYALPLGMAGLLYTVETDFHYYFVSHQFGPAIFAVYSIGCTDLPLITVLADSVSSVMLPRASLLQQENNHREILELLARVARKLSLVYFPVYAFFMAAGHVFIIALFTKRYEASWPVFAVNLTLIPLLIFLADPVVRAFANQRHTLMWLHVGVLASMALIFWKWGLGLGPVGIVAVVVACNVFARTFMLVRILRQIGAAWSDLALLKGVAVIAMVAAVSTLPALLVEALWPSLKPLLLFFVAAAVYGIAYGAGLLALKVIQQDEWDLVRKVVPDRIIRRLA
jgi:O-antigen/teichoic acid export membrane protein